MKVNRGNRPRLIGGVRPNRHSKNTFFVYPAGVVERSGPRNSSVTSWIRSQISGSSYVLECFRDERNRHRWSVGYCFSRRPPQGSRFGHPLFPPSSFCSPLFAVQLI
ncbi:unnamed protein product [Tenebrio molitor]|nr:unnamed protein product [Tenebrio molitor]